MSPDGVDHLLVGLAVRDEEATLAATLDCVADAVDGLRAAHPGVRVTVAVCFNGTSDGSRDVAKQHFLFDRGDLHLLESTPGQVEAERQIVLELGADAGVVVFCDADIHFGPQSYLALLDALAELPARRAVFGEVEPALPERPWSRWQSFVAMPNRHGAIWSPRHHIHGRLFALPGDVARDLLLVRHEVAAGRRARRLRLDLGPLVDDLYLSRAIAARFGPDAIHEVPGALVLYVPPSSLRDRYLARRRTSLEMRRLDVLEPGSSFTQRRYFRRHLRIGSLPWRSPATLLLLLARGAIGTAIAIGVVTEYLLRLMTARPPGQFFPALESTKVAFR